MFTDEKKDKTFDEIKSDVEEKVKKAVQKGSEVSKEAVTWVINNPEMVIAIVGATAGLLRASQSLVVSHRNRIERRRIDHTWYDPSSGFHWELRKKLTNGQRAEILRRRADGQNVYDILSNMGLLK